jgi:hypothetical protein
VSGGFLQRGFEIAFSVMGMTTNLAEFDSWLRKGLGRAVVYLQTHDPQQYRNAVLYACTHDLAYDSQCENRSEAYFSDLIRSAGDRQFFRNGLLDALTTKPNEPEKFDLGQTIEIARTFAEQGDTEIKRAMYEAVVQEGFEHAGHCYADLIKLDGINALVSAEEHFPYSTFGNDDLWQVNVLVTALKERDGVEQANAAIDHARLHSPQLARMLAMAATSDEALEKKISDRKRLDYATLRATITKQSIGTLYSWGKTASEEDLKAAAEDLTGETAETRIIAYLAIFRWRSFPISIHRLLELANSSNAQVGTRAVAALSQLTHADIRAVALKLMNETGRRGDAVDLLINNYEAGDFRMIELALGEPMDDYDVHNLGISVRRLADVHCPKDARDSLLLLYEKGPCSLCRGGFVEHLLALNELPQSVREECRYDADIDTRKLVG